MSSRQASTDSSSSVSLTDLICDRFSTVKTLWIDHEHEAFSEWVALRQQILREAFQSRGIGRILMVEAMVWIQNQGIQKIVLHSREPVISFYEKLGFVAEGEVFHEVGIPHRRMVIQLEN